MLSTRFDPRPLANPDPKVFSLSSPKPWRLKARYLLVFLTLVSLSVHLSSLMAKNDVKPVMWTPPVEPPGAVIVTRNSFDPQALLDRSRPRAEVAAVNLSVVEQSDALSSPASVHVAATEELLSSLSLWSDAWRRQDIGAYLGSYAPSFVPAKGISREAWAKLRTARITGKQNIRHEVRDVNVKLSENKAVVKFTQFYADERLQQTEQKTMHWVLSDGRWLIAREVAH